MTAPLTYPDYPDFLAELKDRILHARTTAARAVNRELILLYWDIGRSIVEKQQKAGWGESIVERLAADLRTAFPDMRGFSVVNLWRMKQLYLDYTSPEFLSHAVREVKNGKEDPTKLSQAVRELVASIPWGHHANLLAKLTDPVARLYYLRATAQFGWSRNVLLHQIKAQAYERAVTEKKAHNFPLALPEYLAEQADEMMKSRYNLEFLGITREVRERELEDRLIAHLQRFLLELGYRGVNKHYMDHRFYRHEKLFQYPEGFGSLFERIPFLNGGLFECLDTGTCKADEVRVDGFSDEPRNQPLVPDVLFFGKEVHADLHAAYGSEKKRDVKVDGLFHILDAYTFTVTENTPIEEEIALDPELLGRIFENLLAEYNPETERTARKETGSFYTPRVIVDYMTGESLKAYLAQELVRRVPRCTPVDARAGLDILFAYTEKEHPFNIEEERALVDAVYEVRTFDPACGSGAFPMGMLQKLVFILEKLDRDHRRWKARIIQDTPPAIREETRQLLDRSSAGHNWKLGLIQHSIYGADIQPIAVQIAKLRCFISLLVDFKVDEQAENKGVPSLPNLDFKFVAANSLIPVPGELVMRSDELGLTEPFFEDFAKAAEEYFHAADISALETELDRLVSDLYGITENANSIVEGNR